MEEACDGPSWLEQYRDERGIQVFAQPSRESGETDDRALLADVAFNRHSMNDGHHVGPSDNATVEVGTDGIRVALAQGIDEESFKRTLSAATRATIGLDLTPQWESCGTDEPEECGWYMDFTHEKRDGTWGHLSDPLAVEGDWEEMLKGGLQTALESQVIVFAVGGVSRTCTHQLVRSRRAAFHQQSQRASYMGDAPEVRMPESTWRNIRARQAFLRATMECWRAYRIACEEDISYQDARFVLQEGTTNFILLEYPVREFLNVYAYRGCSMFQWEIVQVMRECRRVLVEAHPWLEPYVKISCEKTGPATISVGMRTCTCGEFEGTSVFYADCPVHGSEPTGETTVAHHCTFQGWEDVEGQCDFPWAKQEARTFKPEFHRISRSDSKGNEGTR